MYDADANGSRSYLGKGASGRSSSPHNDDQVTDVTMGCTSSHLVDVKMKASDSPTPDTDVHSAREKHRLTQNPIPSVMGKPSQASRKVTVASPVYGLAPVHL